jgi:hypothetical protein
MPQVPYQPAPTVQPGGMPTRPVHVDTPVAAFGGAVAGALEGLGEGMKSAGNELWSRAVALKELQNETKAREADVNSWGEMDSRLIQYKTSEGRDTVAGNQQFNDDIMAIYHKHRDSLDNDSARRMYDASALSNLRRIMLSGADYSSSQQKAWSLNSANAQKDMIHNQMYSHPEDEAGFHRGRQQIGVINQDVISHLRGMDETQLKDLDEKDDRESWAHWISGQAHDAPFKAYEDLQKHKGELGVLYPQVEKAVLSELHGTGARNLATRAMEQVYKAEAEGRDVPTEDELVKDLRDQSQKLIPNDPDFPGAVEKNFIGQFRNHIAIQRNKDYQNRDTLNQVLAGQVLPDGRIPVTVDELRSAGPKYEAAWSALSATKQKEVIRELAARAGQGFAETPEKRAEYYRLYGMAKDPEQHPEFVDEDIIAKHLPKRYEQELVKMQINTRLKPEADPRVGRAMDEMKPSLDAAGITLKDDRDSYNQFRGQMSIMIQDWIAEHNGKQPTREEIRQIGSGLLKDIGGGPINWWPGPEYHMGTITSGTSKLFKQEMSDELYQKILADPRFKEEGAIPPTKEQAQQLMVLKHFKELYSVKPTKYQSPPGSSFRDRFGE